MERPVRIAVVGSVDERLVADLRNLPLRPDVRVLASLVGDSDSLARQQPEVLFVGLGDEPAEDIGAIRLLQRLRPVAIVLVATADRELALAPVAERLAARLVVYPGVPGELAALLEQVLQGSDRPRPALFLDLAHGVADEINNPLLFASGHLQLLRAALDPVAARDRRDQVDAALAGIARIRTSVDRLHLLAAAGAGPRRLEPVDIPALVGNAVAGRREGEPAATVSMPPGRHEVPGDPEQLDAAMTAIVQFADELATLGSTCHVELTPLERGLAVRLRARGPGLSAWQLPRSFEPYYPQRALRGQTHGLGLLLAQTVVLGHRGQATVRRLPDDTLQFDFVLPR